ncbi:MAG: S8 family serine peptidase [gamma proteobacterium endosymbiont of Lamellibrachia anaximandri]|nr:S8 family serine peptidase [gamma proteobacterium endosymbiont of Lamellibrachia anaximandri]
MNRIIDLLKNHPETSAVVINYLLKPKNSASIASIQPDDVNGQYYIAAADIDLAWEYLKEEGKSIGGSKVIIGVADEAIDHTHEDLDAIVLKDCKTSDGGQHTIKSCPKSVIALHQPVDLSIIFGRTEHMKHGTAVTGIIAAKHDEKYMSGIMHDSKVVFVRAGIDGTLSLHRNFSAIARLINGGAKIINTSYGMRLHSAREMGTDAEFCLYPRTLMPGNDFFFEFIAQKKSVNDCVQFDGAEEFKDMDELDLLDPDGKYFTGAELNADLLTALQEYAGFYKTILDSGDFLIVDAAGNANMLANGFRSEACSISRFLEQELRNKILCVAALKKVGVNATNYDLSSFSNYGPAIDVATFGEAITTLVPGNISQIATFDDIRASNGTSLAAPIITGIAGLVWNAFPELTAAQVKESILEGATYTVGNYAKDVPVANALEALKYAKGLNDAKSSANNEGLIAYYEFNGGFVNEVTGNDDSALWQYGSNDIFSNESLFLQNDRDGDTRRYAWLNVDTSAVDVLTVEKRVKIVAMGNYSLSGSSLYGSSPDRVGRLT